MKCRAWETKHENGKTYIHVVDESLEAEYIKAIAERVAKSPLSSELIGKDIAGSYLLAEKGHESISFSAFVPFDSRILEDIQTVKEALEGLVKGQQAEAKILLIIMEKLGLKLNQG